METEPLIQNQIINIKSKLNSSNLLIIDDYDLYILRMITVKFKKFQSWINQFKDLNDTLLELNNQINENLDHNDQQSTFDLPKIKTYNKLFTFAMNQPSRYVFHKINPLRPQIKYLTNHDIQQWIKQMITKDAKIKYKFQTNHDYYHYLIQGGQINND